MDSCAAYGPEAPGTGLLDDVAQLLHTPELNVSESAGYSFSVGSISLRRVIGRV